MTRPPVLGLAMLVLAGVIATADRVCAADAWAASPYQIRVWLAIENVPELQGVRDGAVAQAMVRSTEVAFGAAWELTIENCPAEMHAESWRSLEFLTVAEIEDVQPERLEDDKLIVVAIRNHVGRWQIETRELDCRTQTWQPVRIVEAVRVQRLPMVAAREVVEAFTPIGQIGRSDEGEVEVTMRAGLLTGGAERDRLIPPPSSVFRAVLRKTDRLGKLAENGLQPIPWTLLRVQDNQYADVTCNVVSGLRSPFRSRTSRRIQRLAILVRPLLPQTELQLVAKSDSSKLLTGYDIYYRLPGEKSTTLIDRTDWRGRIVVDRDENPIKILYVKNGGRLLARLPLVPGAEHQTRAEIVDDSARLEAEGFLTGIQEQMVEVMARQQVFAIRIRRALEEKETEKADSLLDELADLPTKEDLLRELRQRQQRLTATNPAVQDRIDRMFRDTRNLIQKYLSTGVVDELRREVLSARPSG